MRGVLTMALGAAMLFPQGAYAKDKDDDLSPFWRACTHSLKDDICREVAVHYGARAQDALNSGDHAAYCWNSMHLLVAGAILYSNAGNDERLVVDQRAATMLMKECPSRKRQLSELVTIIHNLRKPLR